MINLPHRKLLVGAAAAALTSVMPAFAQQAVVPCNPCAWVKTNGINLAVHEAGSGPGFVLLHGFPGVAFNWRHQIPALAAAGYRVMVPDLRGYGQSDTHLSQ